MARTGSRYGGLAVFGLVTVLLSAAPAVAQTQAAAGDMASGGMPGLNIGAGADVDPATAERRREIERAYKNATHEIPAQKAANNDPWANMRGADEQKPVAKTAAKAGKTAQKKKPAQ
jgi:hypothetical protein